jgi:hypothetical protein
MIEEAPVETTSVHPTTAPPAEATSRLPPSTEVVVRVTVVHSPDPAAPPHPRRRRLARSARSALFWGVAVFLVSQLGLALAIEWRLPELREPYYAYKAERLQERIEAAPAAPTVVMLGSSRVVYGLRGQSLERELAGRDGDSPIVFNFGMPGAGPLTQLLALKRLLAEGVRPDVLLIEVLPPVLAGHVPLAEVNRMAPERLWLEDIPVAERYIAPGGGLRAEWWRAWPLPAYHHRFAIVSRVAPALLPFPLRLDWFRHIDDSGWIPPPWKERTPERYRHALERTRGEYLYYLEDFRLGGPNCQALRELLDLCRQERIATVLVLMPEGDDFRGWYSPGAWAQVEGFLQQLPREYGVPLVNAREWSADDDFADSHHLMPAGAERFTARLGREVIVPMLEARRLEVPR